MRGLGSLSLDEKTVVLSKFDGFAPIDRKKQDGDILACVLDVETTGVGDRDKVIQLCVRPFYFDPSTYQVTGIVKSMNFFQDPGESLREEIVQLTGITDGMVKGQTIDWKWVVGMLDRCKFIITHSAKFDRGMIDRELLRSGLSSTEKAIWCCSLRQIDWKNFCKPSHALEVLCAWSGFYYDAHKADVDVDALLHLLRRENRLQELFANAVKPEIRVYASGFPRQLNDELKRRWYSWNGDLKVWFKTFDDQAQADQECEWLRNTSSECDPAKLEIEPCSRFSVEQ